MKIPGFSLFLFAAALMVAPRQLSALDLVRDRRPAVTIVVDKLDAHAGAAMQKNRRKAAGASEIDEAAAVRLLVEWIRKITDVTLPVTNAAPSAGPVLYVGKAAANAGLKLDDISSESHEGLRIVADERRVMIAGQTETATFKAVCRFLETLGCRYFMEGPIGEVYPRTNTLTVDALAMTEKPGLLARNPKGPSWRDPVWRTWNGAGGETFQHQHAWGQYVKESLFDEHPEFFAMGADGRRKRGQWLCTSNPELRRYFAQRVIETIRAGTRNPSLSPTDGRGYCQCPACRQQDNPALLEPSSGVVSISTRYVDFFADVARQVGAVYPESVLSFYCYADYTQPPVAARKLPTNLCAVIAPIRYCRLHELGHSGCPSREQEVGMVEGWSRVASRLGYYNYMYNLADATLPFFKFTPCRKEFPYLAGKGLGAMTIEVLSNWHIYGPQIYLSVRLAYDPTADSVAIMDDYWQKFYGPKAAPFMKQYWMALDARTSALDSHAGGFFGLQQIFSREFLQECGGHLQKAAEAAAGNSTHAARVSLHTEGFQSAVEYRQICEAMNHGDFEGAEKIYDRLFARLRGLAAKGWANPEYSTAYIERFLAKSVRAGARATAGPAKIVQVLPDRWRFAPDPEQRGVEREWQEAKFDDSRWTFVSTRDRTLDAQGFDRTTVLWYRTVLNVPPSHGALTLFFAEVDGAAQVYVNGRKAMIPAPQADANGSAKSRAPFEVEVSNLAHAGENTVAVRVDHTKMTELALGGILRPVVLVDKGGAR